MIESRPILIAGLPKTGTTALAASVRAAVGGAIVFEPSDAGHALSVEDCRVVKIVYAPHESATLADVMGSYSALKRRVWIVRDSRDQLVSAFLYSWYKYHNMPAHRFRTALELVRRRESGELISFMSLMEQSFGEGNYILDPAYYRRIMTFPTSESAAEVFFFHYEDLVMGRFARLSDYLGTDISPAEVDAEHGRVVRTRGTGGWRSWFTSEDRGPATALVGDYMRATGQPDDWATSAVPPDPKFGSYYMVWLWAGGQGPRPTSDQECDAILEAAERAAANPASDQNGDLVEMNRDQ